MITGSPIKTLVLLVLGNLFVAMLAVRVIGHWMKSEWGKLVTTLAGAALVAFVVWAPESAVNLLKSLGNKLIG
ncbi:TcpD family membrane protein [Streptomyces sp. N35]|uniref:TcpD family membrane protein n=1 Tax=Streptomyces sp. N35 TaxID=2795730 RepID=UPI0018F47BF6|nr:TcpD family membrane protein [Streptomyces sp. N35]